MPNYDISNTTDETAYIRVYNPAKYLIRSRNNDPYYFSFTVPAQSGRTYPNKANEVVFKVKTLERSRLKSGNITFSKRNRIDDRKWENLSIGVKITLNADDDTVVVEG